MKNKVPFLSVLIPCRNEENFIAKVLDNILAQDYDGNQVEIFVIDGNSSDNTKNIVTGYKSKFINLKILDNPQQIVPFALNLAIKNASGDFIVRMDAHSEYAPTYLSKVVETFQLTGADIVGGPMRAQGKSDFQKAVAYCTSTKMGVGDSQFHNENFKGYVDSVYLGAWKRELFNEVGFFDESMKRNQDDEFHYRAKSKGKKIYLNPEIHSIYFPRTGIKSLATQYFQYGLYKPLVLKKVKSEIKLRHLIPTAFTAYLLLLLLMIKTVSLALTIPLFIYLVLSLYFSAHNNLSLKSKTYCIIIYPVLHISYGSGFIAGLFKR